MITAKEYIETFNALKVPDTYDDTPNIWENYESFQPSIPNWKLRHDSIYDLCPEELELCRDLVWAVEDTRRRDMAELYLGGEVLESIGEVYGITRERVRQIIKLVTRELRRSAVIALGITRNILPIVRKLQHPTDGGVFAKSHAWLRLDKVVENIQEAAAKPIMRVPAAQRYARPSKEWLRQVNHVEKLSLQRIGEMLGVPLHIVADWFSAYGLKAAGRKINPVPGTRFNRLTFIRIVPTRQPVHYLCLCDCGVEKEIMSRYVRDGLTKSCGCLLRDYWADPCSVRKVGNLLDKEELTRLCLTNTPLKLMAIQLGTSSGVVKKYLVKYGIYDESQHHVGGSYRK